MEVVWIRFALVSALLTASLVLGDQRRRNAEPWVHGDDTAIQRPRSTENKIFDLVCDSTAFASLLNKTNMALDGLQGLVDQAEKKGIVCHYEHLSLEVGSLFLMYAKYDQAKYEEGVEMNEKLRSVAGKHSGRGHHRQYSMQQLAKNLSCVELQMATDVLNNASHELQTLISDPSLHRLPVPAHNMLGVVEKEGYFFRPETGKPVFPGGYDQGIWKYLYGFRSDQVTKQAITLGHDSDELAISIATVLPIDETHVNETLLKFLRERLDYFSSLGLSLSIYTGCELPDWAVAKYPDLLLYMVAGCKINLDVPVVDKLWHTVLTAVYSYVQDHPGLHSFRLANEIWFGAYGNKTKISQMTVDRWHSWLNMTYSGNIERLNKLYDKHYEHITDIPIPGEYKQGALHPLPDNEPVAIGSDMALFLQYRSTQYFSNMINSLKSINGSVKTHIKFVNNDMFSAWPFGGVNRMGLNAMTTWVGCDTRIMPYPVQQIRTPNRHNLQYSLDWLPPALGYTFMRTSTYGKVVVDQEIHPVSTSRDRNASIAFGHMKAAMWIAHLHGLSMHLIWEWSRDANGSASDGLYASLLTMPQTLDDYARSVAYINALAPEVHALATAPRPICIFLSNTAKLTNDKDFFDMFVDTFEAATFFGTQLSIVTDYMMELNATALNSCSVLLLPTAKHSTDIVVQQISKYSSSGGHVVQIKGRRECRPSTNYFRLIWLGRLALPPILHGLAVFQQSLTSSPGSYWKISCHT